MRFYSSGPSSKWRRQAESSLVELPIPLYNGLNILKDWVRIAKDRNASDLLLEAGTPLLLRVRGDLVPVGESISAETLLQSTKEFIGASAWTEYLERRSVDLSRTIHGTRCRLNVFRTVRGTSLAIRLLSSFQNNIRDCNLHPDLKKLIDAKTGLILISGPTGSGKTTTLAACIEEINRTQRKHILAVESPIEYFFSNRQSYIRQREVPTHTPSFEQALLDAMRDNPDVLVIGEMRTPDVMRLTLNAAETGHLVLATLHSSTCAEALSRICLSFPSEIQASIRAQLADCLNAVVCQRLVSMAAG
ncbi:ATPase, T2SS/T4P/T4SS family [Bdellovibrionota bacterium FG-2]